MLELAIDFRDPEIHLADALPLVWAAPYAAEPIKVGEQQRILDNIYDYLVGQRGFSRVTPATRAEIERKIKMS